MALFLLQQPPRLIFSQQPVVFKIQSNSAEIPLRIEGSITGFSGDSIQADAQKKAAFEFSDYLQGLITEPCKTDSLPVIYSSTPKKVTFTFREWVGDEPHISDTLIPNHYYLLEGRVPKSKRLELYASGSSLFEYLKTTSILTWWPNEEAKKITPGQKEFIHFLQLYSESAIAISLHLKLLFRDGTTADAGTVFTLASVAYMELVYFPTGYAELSLATLMENTYPAKTLAGYTVGVRQATTAISSEQSYILDNSYYDATRYLWIKNGFGVLETLLCTGAGSQENEIKTETAVTDGQAAADKLVWKTTKSDVVSVNTGFLTTAQMQWLSDLLDTTEAYERIGSVLHPIVFQDIKISPVHDRDFIFSADLQYEYAYHEVIETGE